MKEKIRLLAAVGVLAAIIYSCSQEGEPVAMQQQTSPDEMIVNNQIARVKAFFDSVRPSTLTTRAAGAGTDLVPDWGMARTWEDDEAFYTEMPAWFNDPLHYAVLIEEWGNTVSFTRQIPYMRIRFNEYKENHSIFCFLIVYLPDATYGGNLSLLASDPQGSNYSGITLYLRLDGTPMWGWRYQSGVGSHTIVYDSNTQAFLLPRSESGCSPVPKSL